ncbi:MAG: hypothetical protein WCG83_03055 [Candidatus Peregrinibacteria bacterium]
MTIANTKTPEPLKENPSEVMPSASERLLLIDQTRDQLAVLARNTSYTPLPAAYQLG